MPLPAETAIATMAMHMVRRPRTIDELVRMMGASQRSVYRWITEMERQGYDVVIRRNADTGVPTFAVIEPPLARQA